jgi:hypothetical protein
MSRPEPIVSVGLPVYNGAAFIRQAIDSVLAQGFTSFELVICDNASTDDTPRICQEYARKDARVRYSRNDSNLGALGNFARTVALATGQYFAWLPHDDCLAPSFLSETVAFLERHPDVALCPCGFQTVDAAGTPFDAFCLPELAAEVPWRQARREFFAGGWRPQLYYSLFGLFRRQVLATVPVGIDRHRGQPVLYLWELPFLGRIATLGKIVALPRVLRSVRQHPESLGCRVNFGQTFAECRSLEAHAKRVLLWIAMTARLPLLEKAELILTSVASLFRSSRLVANLADQVMHYRAVASQQQRRIAALQRTATARSDLLVRIDSEINALQTQLGSLE